MATATTGRRQRRRRGTGSIQLKHGSWFFVTPRDPRADDRQRWLGPFASEREAERFALDWLDELERWRRDPANAVIAVAARPSFEDCARDWRLRKQGETLASTLDGYWKIVEGHFLPVWGDAPIDSLDARQVELYVSHKLAGNGAVNGRCKQKLSPQSVHNQLDVLRQIVAMAIDDGHLRGKNPVDRVKRPQVDHEPNYMTQAEFDRLLGEIPKAHRMLTLTLKELGLRLGEAQGLRWEDYDAATRTLRVRRAVKRKPGGGLEEGRPKSKYGRRSLRVSEGFDTRLVEHRATLDEGALGRRLIFPTSTGGWFSQSNYRNRVFAPALKRAGLAGFRVHDLRHTHAALAIRNDVNPKQLSRRLGHHSVRFTLDTYGGLYEDQLNEVADTL